MFGWTWLPLMIVPACVSASIAYRCKRLADRHRKPDSPAVSPWNEWADLWRPEVYTSEGNLLRTIAVWLHLPIPLAWIAIVVMMMLICSRG